MQGGSSLLGRRRRRVRIPHPVAVSTETKIRLVHRTWLERLKLWRHPKSDGAVCGMHVEQRTARMGRLVARVVYEEAVKGQGEW
jgi:hypothetical protein